MNRIQNRNNKYIKNKSKDTLININLDIQSLQLMCELVISENRNIRRSAIINLKNLIDNLDMSLYKSDPDRLEKIDFIKKGIEARLDYNLTDTDKILLHISGGFLSLNKIDKSLFHEISNDEIKWINGMVADTLKFSFIYNSVSEMEDVCAKFKSEDFSSRKDIVDEFKKVCDNFQNKYRQADANASSDLMFTLESGKFEERIREVYQRKMHPSNKLLTGLVGLNEMLGGGFESGRCYSLFGLPGEGKSMTLLDIAYQIKRYNKGYKCKDKTKKPCIVYFTLENTDDETIVRLCEMVSTNGEDMTDYSIDELLQKLKTDGQLVLGESSPIDICIVYKPGLSVDTSYIYELVDKLDDDGRECICLLLDYIKRIKSSYDNSEMRLTLGNIINELKVFAALKDVPVITASQLNRDATQHIDESRKANKADLVRMLGRSQIGESSAILENLDGAFLIAPEWTQDGKKYLGIQRIKKRYKASNLAYLYYPYNSSDIKLVEDFDAIEPVYKETMKDSVQKFGRTEYKTVSTTNKIKNYDDIRLLANDSSNDNNIFLNAKMLDYNNSTPSFEICNVIERI